MTTPNIDTKALRELRDDACKLDGHSLMEVLHAQQKYERAIIAAAPALLDLADRAQEQAKEIERLNAGWQECLDALFIAREVLKHGADERDALKAEVAWRQEAHDTLFKTASDIQAERNDLQAKLSASEREAERLRAALTPSGETKAAYSHEFAIRQTWQDENGADCASTTYVPWTTIKDIMAAISKRAALRGEEAPRE